MEEMINVVIHPVNDEYAFGDAVLMYVQQDTSANEALA